MKHIILILLFVCSISYGIVLHPGGEPDSSWVGRPSDSVMARVGACSGIVVHPNYVLTARHCSYNLSTPIRVDGVTYYGESYEDQLYFDLRLIKINHEFEDFAPVPEYDLMEFYEDDIDVVVGGFGQVRGAAQYANYDPEVVVGYAWSNPYGFLNWGTNQVYGYNKAAFYIKFNEPFLTPYECGLALYDSGCGVFVYDDGLWWTVGVGKSANDYGFSYFKYPSDPDRLYSSQSTLTRTFHFSGWIYSVIYGADMDVDGEVDLIDLTLFVEDWLAIGNPDYPSIPNYYFLYNSRSDLNQDGKINMLDFAIFAKEWQRP